jgi:hypothetical protein
VQTSLKASLVQSLSLITDLRMANWGSDLVLECLDDPQTRRRYQVVYRNCQEIRLSLHDAAEATREAEADVIGFLPGKQEFAEPAVLTTDIFELVIVYDRYEIRELPQEAIADETRVGAVR